jgi:hypothetical protein
VHRGAHSYGRSRILKMVVSTDCLEVVNSMKTKNLCVAVAFYLK